MPEFMLDNRAIPFHDGQSIMQAATHAGMYIPHLCFHEDLSVHGSCRICMVKVNGRLLSACTTPAASNMQVENHSEQVNAYRRQLLEMLFTEGNHLCPSCEKSGACTLQSVAIFCGMLSPELEFGYPKRQVDASHDDYLIDYNRCINCELCVRASHELDDKSVFRMKGRGLDSHLVVNSVDGLLASSEFEQSDHSASICPVGAILPKHMGFDVPIGKRRFDIEPLSAEQVKQDG